MNSWWKKILPKKDAGTRLDRSQRVRLLFRDIVYMVCEHGKFSVQNLSDSGLGFFYKPGQQFPSSIPARLFLHDETIPVQLEVVRTLPDFIGARFQGDRNGIKIALRKLFLDEIRAAEMSEVASENIRAEEEGTPRWFYAPDNYELFFLEDQGRIKRVEMDLGGKIFMARAGEDLKTGVVPPDERNKPVYAKSQIVHWDTVVQPEDRIKASRVVENILGLTGEEKKMIQNMLEGLFSA